MYILLHFVVETQLSFSPHPRQTSCRTLSSIGEGKTKINKQFIELAITVKKERINYE
jgi:hypothetical protein